MSEQTSTSRQPPTPQENQSCLAAADRESQSLLNKHLFMIILPFLGEAIYSETTVICMIRADLRAGLTPRYGLILSCYHIYIFSIVSLLFSYLTLFHWPLVFLHASLTYNNSRRDTLHPLVTITTRRKNTFMSFFFAAKYSIILFSPWSPAAPWWVMAVDILHSRWSADNFGPEGYPPVPVPIGPAGVTRALSHNGRWWRLKLT